MFLSDLPQTFRLDLPPMFLSDLPQTFLSDLPPMFRLDRRCRCLSDLPQTFLSDLRPVFRLGLPPMFLSDLPQTFRLDPRYQYLSDGPEAPFTSRPNSRATTVEALPRRPLGRERRLPDRERRLRPDATHRTLGASDIRGSVSDLSSFPGVGP